MKSIYIYTYTLREVKQRVSEDLFARLSIFVLSNNYISLYKYIYFCRDRDKTEVRATEKEREN